MVWFDYQIDLELQNTANPIFKECKVIPKGYTTFRKGRNDQSYLKVTLLLGKAEMTNLAGPLCRSGMSLLPKWFQAQILSET